MLNYFPTHFTSKAITLYIGVVIVVFSLFLSRAMFWYWYLFGLVAVVGFFYFSNLYTKRWSVLSEKIFVKRLFSTALIIRLLWVVFSYFFYQYMTGRPFEFNVADAAGYHVEGIWVHSMIAGDGLEPYWKYIGGRYSDMGYPFYLGLQYTLTDDSILIARLLKALYGAFTCLLIYKLAKRNFGEETGRIAGIICMLYPNLIYYCGLHTKEVEMVLLTVWYIERADHLLRSQKYSFLNILTVLLLAVSLFFFRTILGATALMALTTALIFSSLRLAGWKKRISIGVWVIACLMYFVGGRIANEVSVYWQMKDTNQSTSMNWRAEMKGGNKFAKYLTGAVFAPIIFVIPFPTMVHIENQENQQLIHGGNFNKNIMAFFVFVAGIWIIRNKKWRDHTLIGSFTIGYLMVLAFSAFAGSERFHLPALPFLLIFAAFGITRMNNSNKRYYVPYLIFIAVAIVFWNWFKLAGRGMA